MNLETPEDHAEVEAAIIAGQRTKVASGGGPTTLTLVPDSPQKSPDVAGTEVPDSELLVRPDSPLAMPENLTEYPLISVSPVSYWTNGPLVGAPTVFVHIGVCKPACIACVGIREPVKRAAHEIVKQVLDLARKPLMVTLTGNRLSRFADLELVSALNRAGCPVVMETDCIEPPKWVDKLMHLMICPQPPSSGRPTHIDRVINAIRLSPRHTNGVSVKIRVSTDADLDYALHTLKRVQGQTTRAPQLFIEPVHKRQDTGSPQVVPDGVVFSESVVARLDAAAYFANIFDQVTGDDEYQIRILPALDVLATGESHGF